MSYRHKLSAAQALADPPGVTTEISGLTTYVLGALVSNGYYWIAVTIAVVSLFLLELKGVLEGLSKRLAPHEILTFTKFLLLTAVILPTVPNTPFTQFGINPFKTWLLVVAVCGISYGSYVLLGSYQADERSASLWITRGCLLFYRDHGCIGEESCLSRGALPVLWRDHPCLSDDVRTHDSTSDAL